jgi:hypothetical protein
MLHCPVSGAVHTVVVFDDRDLCPKYEAWEPVTTISQGHINQL